MSAFSPKLTHVRSISFPAKSPPKICKLEEELNTLSSWEASLANAETIHARLSGLGEIYRCIEDLLNLTATQQALAQHQEEKWVGDMLDDLIRYLDVEHVIREQNVLAANEFVGLLRELVVARLTLIAKQRECPADLKEGIARIIFASPRCSEIPELVAMRNIFKRKYGEDFVSAAIDLRPNCGVNRMLIDKLSVRTPTDEELLKGPGELIKGPNPFVGATSLPVKPASFKTAETNNPTIKGAMGSMQFEDTASAAEAAAESAKEAIAAAQAAAYLANKNHNQALNHLVFNNSSINPATATAYLVNKNFNQASQPPDFSTSFINTGFGVLSGNSMGIANNPQINYTNMDHQSQVQMDSEHIYRRHSHKESRPIQMDGQTVHRRHSYNASSPNSEMKFDESDCDGEIEMEDSRVGIYPPPPPKQPPPVPSSHVDRVPRVHPKLPDYDELAALFEGLKYHKSQTLKL
ncbi:hypothetical protein GH714_016461 [Hevea brasiliensis]|uniref:Uncharacterized protein n=1 Tax=Hevea brasiliensis TaxID=3981 RepID=A0A6A6M1D7_HEVBR|nr:hypothetical protein GH714_016461 [Hevea brasiliensis]